MFARRVEGRHAREFFHAQGRCKSIVFYSLTVIHHLRVLVDFFEYPSDVLPGSRQVAVRWPSIAAEVADNLRIDVKMHTNVTDARLAYAK